MKKPKYILLPILLFTLTSCDLNTDLFSLIFSSCTINPTNDDEGKEATNADVTLEKHWKNIQYTTLKATGDQKMLVIPVEFEGNNLKYSTGFTTKTVPHTEPSKETLYNAFFGESSDTGWESVSSFYKKSSYENLRITGQVSDAYHPDISVTDLVQGKGKAANLGDPTWYILRSAVEWVRNNCSDINLSDYDKDKDGYIDSVFLVYNVDYNGLPSSIDESSVLWAYTYWDYEISASLANPTANVYGWASSKFLSEGGYSKPDAHTFIHESGHILGLDDYYTYDGDDYGAIGRLDMMDSNIGDHDAFSKAALGWTTPTHITEEGSYTLRPFESSGDCIVLKPDWKGSMLDEYLILEYYTPTGLNKLDAETAYAEGSTKMFQNAGLKVLHVDARLMKIVQKSNGNTSASGYATSLINSYNKISKELVYTDFAASNTASRSLNGQKLISIIDANAKNESKSRLVTGTTATATDTFLFHATSNNKFAVSGANYEGFTFHSGLKLDYGFTITQANSSGMTLNFVKL